MAKREEVVNECDRCLRPTPATVTVRFCVDDQWYEMDLDDKHAEMWDREISPWRRVAREIDAPRRTVFTAERRERHREVNQLRDLAARAQQEAAAKVRGAERAQQIADAEHREVHNRMTQAHREWETGVKRSIPGALLWGLSDHAWERMQQRGFELADVLWTATHPQATYQQPWRGLGQAIYVRDIRDGAGTVVRRCRLVVDELHRTVITVINHFDESETADSYRRDHTNNQHTLEGQRGA